MGHSAASISTIFDLTCVDGKAAALLQSLWMQSRSILNLFCISLVNGQDLHPSELGWTLHCTNTIDRLHQAYEWMFEHVCLLKQESEKISQELRDCGEECTDLW
jgi:hypothetical protein